MNAARPTTDTILEKALRSLRGAFSVVGLFSLFINILMLTAPLYMLQVYDRVLASRHLETLVMLTLVAVGLLFAGGLLDIVRSRLLVRIGIRLDSDVNEQVFSAVFEDRLRGQQASDGQPIRDLDTLRTFLTGNALVAFFDAPWTPFFIVIVFFFHPVLGVVALSGAAILLLLAVLSEVASRQPLQLARQKSAAASAYSDACLQNAESVRAMGMRINLLRRWLDFHLTSLVYQGAASDRTGIVTALAKMVRQILQVVLLGAGAYLVIQQEITPGVMIAASILMGRALAPVESAIGGWRGFIAARGAYRRLVEALALLPPVSAAMRLPKPIGQLTAEGAVFAFPGTRAPVLKGISFDLEPGESLGVIGKTAAGKTTLARLLVGVCQPNSGHVRLDGADIYEWNHDQLGEHIGYLPEGIELLDGSVAENVAKFGPVNPEAVVSAATRATAHEMILALPDGYDTMVGEGGDRLSAGQRQRIGLARALYGNPSLVVLDEPNANVDFEGDQAIVRAINDLKNSGTTVVVMSHRPSILACVDKLLVLRAGRVEMFGPCAKVVQKLSFSPVPRIGEDARLAQIK